MLNIVTRQAFQPGEPIRVDGKMGRVVEMDTLGVNVEFPLPGLTDENGVQVMAKDRVYWGDILQAMITRS